jgi:hypothetical protein
MRIACADLVDDGSLGGKHAVACLTGVNTPTVTDNEYYWSHFSLLLFKIQLYFSTHKYIKSLPCRAEKIVSLSQTSGA